MDADSDRLRELELAALMRATRSLTIGLFYFMVLLVILMRDAVRGEVIVTWCVTFLAYMAARIVVLRHFSTDRHRTTTATITTIAQWRIVVYVSVFLLGLLLGSLAWIAMPVLDLPGRLALTGLLLIMSTAASVHSLSFVGALLLMNVMITVPFALAWWLLPSQFQYVGLGMLLQPVVATYIARNRFQASRDSWQLVVKNERLARELTERNRELHELGNSRNRLFAVAGHDLRQPVYALGLTIEQLNEYDPPQVLRQHFERLRESSYLVSEMLQDLMDISNLERKDYPLHVDVVPLGPLLEQLRLSQDAVARAKGLRLEISPGAAGLAVRSDANLLRRILMNLVSNAIKYTIQGKVNIECTRDGEEVRIRIIDTGIGIPAEHLDDVFHDYVRVNGQHRKDDGVGLGLSVVRRAVDLLGHELTVQSEVGIGSVFELRVKAAQLHETGESPGQADEGHSNAELVLLIEDDEYVRQALSGLLVQWGYTPVTASTAQEALTQLDPAATPALIIADLQLSLHEDGFDAIALVRQRTGNMRLPALLLTGDVRPSLIPKAADHGITVAHKPLPPPVLRQKIRSLLETA